MDISSVISKNIDGYLKPKHPIYKITYIHTKIKYNHEDGHGETYIKTSSKIGLFQYVDDDDSSTNIDFDECKFYKSIIDGFNEDKCFTFCDEYYASETWSVIGLEQVA